MENNERPLLDVAPVQEAIEQIKTEAKKLLIAQSETIELLLIGLLAGGHILLEGVPGIAKTLSARVLARTLDAGFVRIQFTPDKMPADIIGTSIFDMKKSAFEFIKGPVFSNIVLIDEINRAPAKTQSALFEVMEEKQISYDGKRYIMEFPFMVIATQNPIEQEGTYRLPEAQLDRFLMKIKLNYPTLDQEVAILDRFKTLIGPPAITVINKILKPKRLKSLIEVVTQVHIDDKMLTYIAQLVHETRHNSRIYLGASPRASLAIMKCAKVAAAINGRDYVSPDDIQFLAPHILNHRMLLTPDAEMEGAESEDVISEIITNIEVPR